MLVCLAEIGAVAGVEGIAKLSGAWARRREENLKGAGYIRGCEGGVKRAKGRVIMRLTEMAWVKVTVGEVEGIDVVNERASVPGEVIEVL